MTKEPTKKSKNEIIEFEIAFRQRMEQLYTSSLWEPLTS